VEPDPGVREVAEAGLELEPLGGARFDRLGLGVGAIAAPEVVRAVLGLEQETLRVINVLSDRLDIAGNRRHPELPRRYVGYDGSI
jgi:hypothetical protein